MQPSARAGTAVGTQRVKGRPLVMAYSNRHAVVDRPMKLADDDGGRCRQMSRNNQVSLSLHRPVYRDALKSQQSRQPIMDSGERVCLKAKANSDETRRLRIAQLGKRRGAQSHERWSMHSVSFPNSLCTTPYCAWYYRGSFQNRQSGETTKYAHSNSCEESSPASEPALNWVNTCWSVPSSA